MNKNSLLNQRYICPIGADGVQYALKNNIDRLKVDYENAVYLETDLRAVAGIGIAPNSGATNMFCLNVPDDKAEALRTTTHEQNIIFPGSSRWRLLTHMDVNRSDMDQVIAVFKQVMTNRK